MTFSVHPVRLGGMSAPPSAVCVHGDDQTARQAVFELARRMSVEDYDDLRYQAQRMDDGQVHPALRESHRAYANDILDQVTREHGSDLTDLWRLRIPADQAAGFVVAIWDGFQHPKEAQP